MCVYVRMYMIVYAHVDACVFYKICMLLSVCSRMHVRWMHMCVLLCASMCVLSVCGVFTHGGEKLVLSLLLSLPYLLR